jgi:hypothetical protein
VSARWARIERLAISVAIALVVSSALPWRRARAYDPATTHAGLTERAVLASSLHRVLSRRLARPLGLFEPIALRSDDLPAEEARYLLSRLATLDPSGGYRPGPGQAAPALAWVVSGSVIAQTPAERGRNQFYDPARGSGLAEGGGVVETVHTLEMLLDGGNSVRALATGTDFNLTGPPATTWLVAPENDVGLPVFYAELEAAVASEQPARRATALARALLALGGTLSVLEDAGEPAHVRNDFRGAYLGSLGGGPFDRASAYERFVADTYGRAGVPAAGPAVDRPNVMAYLTAADAQGLADRTQRRFFSEGTVPEDAVVDHESTSVDVLRDARASLAYGLPGLPRLDLHTIGERRYVYTVGEAGGGGEGAKVGPAHLTSYPPARVQVRGGARRLLAYQRVPGRVRFFLDDAVYADTARALLPEIGGYGAGLIDLLFRGEVTLEVSDGSVSARVGGARGRVRGGQIRIFAEDAKGQRRLIGSVASGGSVSIPSGTRRIAAVLRAEDDAGVLVAVAEQALPH